LNAAEDIVENDELSEPEIQKFAFQISPLRLLFACETAEERNKWINFVQEALFRYCEKKSQTNVTSGKFPS